MQRIHALPPDRQNDFAQSDFEADRTLKAMDARPARISTRLRLSATPVRHHPVMIAFGSRNSLKPKMPPSRPIPDCLKPPNGASGSWLRVLISTRPASSSDIGYEAELGIVRHADGLVLRPVGQNR